MTNKEIINYAMNSPENTNPAILNQMLEENKNPGIDMIIYETYKGEMWYEGNFSKTVKKSKEYQPIIILNHFVGEGYLIEFADDATKYDESDHLVVLGTGVKFLVYPDGTVTREF